MQPQQAYPQGYPQPFGAPVRLRANPVASALAGLLTFARRVAGAWTVAVACLLFSIMIVITPLLRGEDVGTHLDFVFGFHKTTGVAIGLTTIVGVLTAIIAVVAAVAKRPAGGSVAPAAWGQPDAR